MLIIGSKARLEDDLYISVEGESIYRSPYHKSLGFLIDKSIDSESFPHLKNVTSIEEDIQSLVTWLANNKFMLNVLKTEFLIIGFKARVSRLKDDLYISVEGESIYRSPYHKSLGFVIDESIDWEDHINAVIKKANCDISVLRSARPYLSLEVP